MTKVVSSGSKIVEILTQWKECNFPLKEVEYRPEWENSTGYFDHAVTDHSLAQQIPEGTLGWSRDPHGRVLLIAPTLLGNVVVFDRYAAGPNWVVVSNVPTALRPVLPHGQWGQDQLDHWFCVPSQLPYAFVNGMVHSISVHQKRLAKQEASNE
jgi:hypothetical protein